MKQIRLVATVIALIICNAVSAQDYYTGKTYVGENDRYKVTVKSYADGEGNVYLSPVSPSVFDKYPYDTKTGKVYTYDYNPSRHTHLRPEDIKKIVARVFSPEERERYENCPHSILIEVAIRPSDGRVIDCKYSIRFDENKDLLSIPPKRIEELDKEIKASLVISVPEFGKDASYLMTGGWIF